MNPNITVELKEHYLEVKLKGEVTFQDYVSLMSKVKFDEHLPKHLRVLGIDDGVSLKFGPSDALLLSKMRDETVSKFLSVKHAFLVEDPLNTALAVLTTSAMKSENYHVEIFSSRIAAEQWLKE
ncbi:MAG: hypothetical protein JXR60_09930 [Bacteroidales bacterium]|nr:hypothetical protein [Bacteroidales bacterium]